MIKKLTVVGLLGLILWNAALAKTSGVLLCLGDDLEVHLSVDETDDQHCEGSHEKALSEKPVCHNIENTCTDLKLEGGAFISVVPSKAQILELSQIAYVQRDWQLPSKSVVRRVAKLQAAACGPPHSACWLTDRYIRKIVIRV